MALWAHVTAGFVDTLAGYDQAPDDTWVSAPAGTTVGDSYDGSAFAHVNPSVITSTEFLNRIPPTALTTLWGNAQTGIMLITLAAASMIDLNDPKVKGGINGLVPSVLTAAQALAILTP
jgi:hypothetical protein